MSIEDIVFGTEVQFLVDEHGGKFVYLFPKSSQFPVFSRVSYLASGVYFRNVSTCLQVVLVICIVSLLNFGVFLASFSFGPGESGYASFDCFGLCTLRRFFVN